MRLFRSEEEVEDWCTANGRSKGAVVPIATLQALARDWYGDRLDPEWRPRTADESQAVLAAAGLSGPFWSLR